MVKYPQLKKLLGVDFPTPLKYPSFINHLFMFVTNVDPNTQQRRVIQSQWNIIIYRKEGKLESIE